MFNDAVFREHTDALNAMCNFISDQYAQVNTTVGHHVITHPLLQPRRINWSDVYTANTVLWFAITMIDAITRAINNDHECGTALFDGIFACDLADLRPMITRDMVLDRIRQISDAVNGVAPRSYHF